MASLLAASVLRATCQPKLPEIARAGAWRWIERNTDPIE